MAWFGVVQPSSGELLSLGTEAMFPNGDINAFVGRFDRVDFGETRPDFAVKRWNVTTRALEDRPLPVLISRLDDIEAWLQADADWVAVWTSLNAARRTQIRTGLRRILTRLMGPRTMREENEQAEL
jgi:hypothetical protein